MHSSYYETPTFHFQRLRLWQVSQTKVTLPGTSGQLPAFLLAWLAINSRLGPRSFLIAPPRLEANNSARTYRSRPLHPRPIVPSLRSSLHWGNERGREMKKLIAIIDDDDAMQDSLHDLMEAAGLVARCFGSAEEFLESGLHRQAACLITDILMPKMSGLELQTRLKEEECEIPIIFITAHGDGRMRIQAMREGAVEFLAKPFDHQLLLKTVRAALDM